MKCMSRAAAHNVVHLNRLKWTSLDKAKRMRKGPVKALRSDLPCWTRNPSKLDPWLLIRLKKIRHMLSILLQSLSVDHDCRRINSLIGSVKQTETGNIRTIELNSMNCRLQCLNQWARSMFQVSPIMQVAKRIDKCQTKTIQSPSHFSLWVCFAISLQLSLAVLITRVAAILRDKFPHNNTLILSVGHLNSYFLWKITGAYE